MPVRRTPCLHCVVGAVGGLTPTLTLTLTLTIDVQEDLQQRGFMQIKMRHAGRYDLQLPELSTPAFSFLLHDAPWMPLVRTALG